MNRFHLLLLCLTLSGSGSKSAEPVSVPTPVLNVSGNDLIISLSPTLPDRLYQLRVSDQMTPGSWSTVEAKTATDANGVAFTVTGGAASDKAFYRITLVDVGIWTLVDSNGPPETGIVTYDTNRHVTVMFGGSGSYGNDIWEFDGTSWRLVNVPGPLPQARDRSGKMVYDPEGSRVLMLGGWWPDDNDPWTWEYVTTGTGPDEREWHNLVSSGPAFRGGIAMTWDSTRRRALLFGGNRYQTFYNDAWSFDAATNTWSNLGGWGPSRFGCGLVYDSTRDRFVMFGGTGRWWAGDTEQGRGNTNEFDPLTNTWTEIVPQGAPGAPGPRWFPSMVFDPVAGVTIMRGGGRPSDGFSYEEEWIWDGQSWLQIPLTPEEPTGGVMWFDSEQQEVMLYSAPNTWRRGR